MNTQMSVGLFRTDQPAAADPRKGALHVVTFLVPNEADWVRVWWAEDPGRPPRADEYWAAGRPTSCQWTRPDICGFLDPRLCNRHRATTP